MTAAPRLGAGDCAPARRDHRDINRFASGAAAVANPRVTATERRFGVPGRKWPACQCRGGQSCRPVAFGIGGVRRISFICQNVMMSSYCHVATLQRQHVVNLPMPLSAFIADSTSHSGPRRYAGGGSDWIPFAAPPLRGAAARACAPAGEPFDLAPQRPAMRAPSTMRMEARRG